MTTATGASRCLDSETLAVGDRVVYPRPDWAPAGAILRTGTIIAVNEDGKTWCGGRDWKKTIEGVRRYRVEWDARPGGLRGSWRSMVSAQWVERLEDGYDPPEWVGVAAPAVFLWETQEAEALVAAVDLLWSGGGDTAAYHRNTPAMDRLAAAVEPFRAPVKPAATRPEDV